jgi:hypothetical protein
MAMCLNCEAATAVTRGLCQGCYTSAWRLVKSGATTWNELEARGKASAKSNASRAASLLGLDKPEPREYILPHRVEPIPGSKLKRRVREDTK